ncbi:MAG: hypothetical protein M8835_01965, partial [marine benthic group bacterium]|nr:hypothetical protein [Gemmatimonadota bacterium]
AILNRMKESDLLVMGTQRRDRGGPNLGSIPIAIARRSEKPIILINRRAPRSVTLGLEISAPDWAGWPSWGGGEG